MGVLARAAEVMRATFCSFISSRSSTGAPLGVAALALVLCSCGVDERDLVAATVGDSGGSAGIAGSSSSAGGGSPPGLNAPDPPNCTYVGAEVPEGCETLVDNPGFDKGISGWPPENVAVLVGWNNRDASDSDESGSLIVENTLSLPDSNAPGELIIGARQCVPASAGAVYDVTADLFIPMQETNGRAGVSVYFYKSADCNSSMGGTDMSFTPDLAKKQEEWTPVAGRFVVPDKVGSMEVRLVAAKTIAPRSFMVLFDNVLVQAK